MAGVTRCAHMDVLSRVYDDDDDDDGGWWSKEK